MTDNTTDVKTNFSTTSCQLAETGFYQLSKGY